MRKYVLSLSLVLAGLVGWQASSGSIAAQEKSKLPPVPEGYDDTPVIPGQSWRVHDRHRPRPPVVKAGEELGQPPSDAVVLFGGKDLAAWETSGKKGADGKPAPAGWKVENGYMEVVSRSGSIQTREHFGDCQLHIEWATPSEVKGKSQGRGNSGVIIMGRYEIQVLDSFENDTYPDGQAASIYGQHPPQVNVARAPGKWQIYDIIFEAPRFEGEKLVKPARATVFHNGVLVQNAKEFVGPMAHKEVHPYRAHGLTGPLQLQDHGNPTRFRNIWYRPLRVEQTPWLSLPGGEGKGKGKKVVLLAGDEEYRSEEALPQLAKILSKHHGFDTTVLFSTDPDSGLIDPNMQTNIPGMHHLKDADLVILSLRFRELPDWQMQYFVDYINSGKPVIGLRTATHAFNYSRSKDSPFASWSFNSNKWQGGFGQQVLGDTWISHHGRHGSQSTRGVINEANKSHAVLKGVKDVWGPTDVYGIKNLPKDATVLLWGQVLAGMDPSDKAIDGPVNNPQMPLAWVREHKTAEGKVCKVFCTTMGASTDLQSEDLRRLIVNAAYWATGLESQIPERSEASIVGEFKPSMFGFKREPNFWSGQNLTPASFAN